MGYIQYILFSAESKFLFTGLDKVWLAYNNRLAQNNAVGGLFLQFVLY